MMSDRPLSCLFNTRLGQAPPWTLPLYTPVLRELKAPRELKRELASEQPCWLKSFLLSQIQTECHPWIIIRPHCFTAQSWVHPPGVKLMPKKDHWYTPLIKSIRTERIQEHCANLKCCMVSVHKKKIMKWSKLFRSPPHHLSFPSLPSSLTA